MTEETRYLNEKLQIARACAQTIRNKAMDLEDFVRCPTSKRGVRQQAIEQLQTIRLTSSRIIATSDRALTDSVPLDIDMLIEQLNQIIEHKCSNLTDNEHRNLLVLASEVWATLYKYRPKSCPALAPGFLADDHLQQPMEAA